MANRYWVGGTNSWNGTADSKWSDTSGGAGGASEPTVDDDVFFDSASGVVTVTVATSTRVCRSLNFTGFTGTFAGSIPVHIYGSYTLPSGMTRSHTGGLFFKATTTGHVITTSILVGSVTFDGVGGEWTQASALSVATITILAGSLVTANFNISCNTTPGLTVSGDSVKALSLGSTTFTGTWNILSTNNFTFDAGTSTITHSPIGHNFVGGGLTYYNVNYQHPSNTNSTLQTMYGANTFNNLNISSGVTTGGARTLFDANQIVNGTFSTGLSLSTRGKMGSSVTGVQRTITAAVSTINFTDFQDIVGAGAATWTAASIGDGGNNSGITFPSPVTRYWVNNGGNFSSTTKWSTTSGGSSGASVPLIHDIVVFDANSITSASQTITIDRDVPTLDFRNLLNNPTIVQSGGRRTFFGSIHVDSNVTYNFNINLLLIGGVGNVDINMNGLNMSTVGTVEIYHALTVANMQSDLGAANSIFSVRSGTLNTNNYNILSRRALFTNENGTQTKTVNMGSSIWTITGVGLVTTGYIWDAQSTYLTFNAGTSTILVTSTATGSQFFGGGKNYYKLESNPASGNRLHIFNDNSFQILHFKGDVYFGLNTTNVFNEIMKLGSTYGGFLTSNNGTSFLFNSNPHYLEYTGIQRVVIPNGVMMNSNMTAPYHLCFCPHNGTTYQADYGFNSGWNFTEGEFITFL